MLPLAQTLPCALSAVLWRCLSHWLGPLFSRRTLITATELLSQPTIDPSTT
jgi:hypothetical protein